MPATALFRLYQALAALALPFAARSAVNKLRRAGVPIDRAHERLGHATERRPLGPLIWFHGASVGEAKSALPLMHHIAQTAPHVRLLLTSGTATSATAVANRLPAGAVHQFGPLDGAGPMQRFLDHWRPDLCVLVESELWPNLLDLCARRDLPVALINARLSDRSAQGWTRFPGTAAHVLRGIRMAHCQDRRTQDNLRAMGMPFARAGANLKSLVSGTGADAALVRAAQDALGPRPVWVAASTHPGEEEAVLNAHARLVRDHPHLCLILAPRHPERGDDVVALINAAGLSCSRRSTGGPLGDSAQVYLADTMGETDLWYTLSPIVFLGGSFSDVGGHTPFEPAAVHCAILHGPHYANFAEAYAAFHLADAAVEVADGNALGHAVHDLLTDPGRAARLAARARPLALSGDDVLPPLAQDLLALAGIEGDAAHA
ncbi:MAG: 3-deoxy-D-manno-octulosonic acid transferase [Pseudomonadota bacterium]